MNNKAYEKYREKQIENGLLYQDFVVDIASTQGLIIQQYASKAYQISIGESRTGIEIKLDNIYAESNNLFIEIAEKARPRPGSFVPSGIYANEKTWLYWIGNYDIAFIFLKKFLISLHKAERYQEIEIKLGTSRGFLIPDADARKYAEVWEIYKGEEIRKIVERIEKAEALKETGKELHRLALENPAQLSLFTTNQSRSID